MDQSISAMAAALVGEHRSNMERYQMWKLKAPHLYDFVISSVFHSPVYTVQWLPDREETSSGEHSRQKLILGTHSLGLIPNYLLLVEILHFHKDVEVNLEDYKHERGEIGEVDGVARQVKIVRKLSFPLGIARARYMPQRYSVVGARTVTGQVFVFDWNNHPGSPLDWAFTPDLILKGKNFEGIGLSWSPFKAGHLLASANDDQIKLWDILATPKKKLLDPLHVFKAHTDAVEDVAWHMRHDNIFGSVGDDCSLRIWDLRAPLPDNPILSVVAHNQDVNCLAFNPFNEWILATGSDDGTLKLFDIRKIHAALHTFRTKADEVFQVGWSPKNESILASSSMDRSLSVWDASRIGNEQTSDEARNNVPELLLVHEGHTQRVLDFSWNPWDDGAIATVSENNIVQIWKMAKHIYNGDNDEVPSDDPY